MVSAGIQGWSQKGAGNTDLDFPDLGPIDLRCTDVGYSDLGLLTSNPLSWVGSDLGPTDRAPLTFGRKPFMDELRCPDLVPC